jgi:hypothetical protein
MTVLAIITTILIIAKRPAEQHRHVMRKFQVMSVVTVPGKPILQIHAKKEERLKNVVLNVVAWVQGLTNIGINQMTLPVQELLTVEERTNAILQKARPGTTTFIVLLEIV